jgi:hypothetical protein
MEELVAWFRAYLLEKAAAKALDKQAKVQVSVEVQKMKTWSQQ